MQGLISENPVRKTKLPRRGPMAEKAPIAPETVKALLEALPEPSRSLAWLLARSPVILPIPGTSNVKHLEENASAAAFRLTDEEFAELAAVVPKPYWLRA